MIVHLGVIVIAVAIAASRSYGSNTEFVMKVGETRTFQGHEVKLVKLRKATENAAGERVFSHGMQTYELTAAASTRRQSPNTALADRPLAARRYRPVS